MPSPVDVPEYSTQFEPLPDDSDTLWNVLEILKENKQRYLVKWEGIDPETGKPWRHSWVPKSDCTDDLIREWKITKAKKAKKRDPGVYYFRSPLVLSLSPCCRLCPWEVCEGLQVED